MAATAPARPKVLSLTDAAAEQILRLKASKPDAYALKLGVTKGGCAGMEYTMDWVGEAGKYDEVVEEKGARVLIDPMAILYLLGTEMDFEVDKLSAQFVFNNPNQTSACGCGESVELKAADPGRIAEFEKA
ncbi:MAG: iron-sulfur cluster assembly accessory protein [Pseudomonadota bacterium]